MITTMVWVIIVIIILVLLMILVLKMTKKYHITWYWCQNMRDNMVEKRVKKIGLGSPLGLPPPFSGNARKKIFFLAGGLPFRTLEGIIYDISYIRQPQFSLETGDCRTKYASTLTLTFAICYPYPRLLQLQTLFTSLTVRGTSNIFDFAHLNWLWTSHAFAFVKVFNNKLRK